jgi:predicted MFS family arabinose efflux permease
MLFSLGGIVTSQAPSLEVFLLGRAITGAGGAGIMTISFILVLELSGKKRRGLFIGLVNTGFTLGVSLGAVIAGGLLNVTGWVSAIKLWGNGYANKFVEILVLDPISSGPDCRTRHILQHPKFLPLGAERSRRICVYETC